MVKPRKDELFQLLTMPYIGYRLLKLDDCRTSDELTHCVIAGVAWNDQGPVRAHVSSYSEGSELMDCSFTHMGIPVLTRRAREFFTRWSAAELEFVSVSITGYVDEHFCMNVLSVAKEDLIDGPQLFRLESDRQVLIVRPQLVTRLIDSDLVGPGLVSVTTGRTLFPGRRSRPKGDSR
jgi:hypothetical protein